MYSDRYLCASRKMDNGWGHSSIHLFLAVLTLLLYGLFTRNGLLFLALIIPIAVPFCYGIGHEGQKLLQATPSVRFRDILKAKYRCWSAA